MLPRLLAVFAAVIAGTQTASATTCKDQCALLQSKHPWADCAPQCTSTPKMCVGICGFNVAGLQARDKNFKFTPTQVRAIKQCTSTACSSKKHKAYYGKAVPIYRPARRKSHYLWPRDADAYDGYLDRPLVDHSAVAKHFGEGIAIIGKAVARRSAELTEVRAAAVEGGKTAGVRRDSSYYPYVGSGTALPPLNSNSVPYTGATTTNPGTYTGVNSGPQPYQPYTGINTGPTPYTSINTGPAPYTGATSSTLTRRATKAAAGLYGDAALSSLFPDGIFPYAGINTGINTGPERPIERTRVNGRIPPMDYYSGAIIGVGPMQRVSPGIDDDNLPHPIIGTASALPLKARYYGGRRHGKRRLRKNRNNLGKKSDDEW